MAFNLTPASIATDTLLAADILTGGGARDVVGVFDQQTLEQLFMNARPMKAHPRQTSRVMDHPVETGVTLSDHKVINPTVIELTMTIKARFYSSALEQIRSAFTNSTLLSVQTKSGVFQNMVIQELPIDEDPDTFDMIVLGLRMREVIFIAPTSITQSQGTATSITAPQNYAPADPENNNTVNRGLQAAKPLTSQQVQSIQSILNTPAPS